MRDFSTIDVETEPCKRVSDESIFMDFMIQIIIGSSWKTVKNSFYLQF